jgi:DNA end-binding protein Ku
MHHLYYANEVRSYDDVELGPDPRVGEHEEALADQLIASLASEGFDPGKYSDEFATRVHEAANQKFAGQEVTTAPEQPQAQIIDLFEALKQSLREAEQKKASSPLDEPKKATGTGDVAPVAAQEDEKPRKRGPTKGPKKA